MKNNFTIIPYQIIKKYLFLVGLGAVWRFPYLCYKNGGGAFLIPFLLFLLLLGIPLMYMELSLGQFTALGPIKSWVMVSLSRGIGISTTIINNYLSVYYIMIIGYSLYYLILSLRIKLPWQDCEYDKWASASIHTLNWPILVLVLLMYCFFSITWLRYIVKLFLSVLVFLICKHVIFFFLLFN